MRRRDFITLLGGAATSWPAAARAQQSAMPVIGLLGSESPDLFASRLGAFRQGLGEFGYVEDRNVTIKYSWANGQNERLPDLAADLVRRKVNLIFAASTPAGPAAKAATTNIPIVFVTGSDPVASGLVASLNRPGGNLTGVTGLGVELVQKQLDLLHELVPSTTAVSALVNPTSPTAESLSNDVQTAARTLGLELHVMRASTEHEIDTAFATMAQLWAGALVIATDVFFTTRIEQLVALTVRHTLPSIYQFREFAAAGGLMSYGSSLSELYRQAGIYTARILKGEKPADLPVMQPTKFELIINLKTAKALGLDIPAAVLARADEVIE